MIINTYEALQRNVKATYIYSKVENVQIGKFYQQSNTSPKEKCCSIRKNVNLFVPSNPLPYRFLSTIPCTLCLFQFWLLSNIQQVMIQSDIKACNVLYPLHTHMYIPVSGGMSSISSKPSPNTPSSAAWLGLFCCVVSSDTVVAVAMAATKLSA